MLASLLSLLLFHRFGLNDKWSGLCSKKMSLLNFTGIDSPYKVPEKPEVYFSTDKEDLDLILRSLLAKLNLSL
jgi:adenylylsulfate kinase-like enzyme